MGHLAVLRIHGNAHPLYGVMRAVRIQRLRGYANPLLLRSTSAHTPRVGGRRYPAPLCPGVLRTTPTHSTPKIRGCAS